jgi:hypothetical protein
MKNSNLCNKYRHNTVFHDEGVSSAVITQAKKCIHDFYTIRKNNQYQNKNLKFDDFKANIARQLQLFSMHLYRFVLLVHTFA